MHGSFNAMSLCRDTKATSLASKVAEQFGTAGASYIPLRHTASAGAAAEAGDAGQSVKAAARVHRPVVRESDMRKFAGQVSGALWHSSYAATPVLSATCS